MHAIFTPIRIREGTVESGPSDDTVTPVHNLSVRGTVVESWTTVFLFVAKRDATSPVDFDHDHVFVGVVSKDLGQTARRLKPPQQQTIGRVAETISHLSKAGKDLSTRTKSEIF